jgi:DNA-binding response OmpR family regulator
MLAYIVIELAEAKGGFISQYDLLNLRENITVRKTEVDINTLRGYIYRIRKVLGKESIISFNGEGYAMSSETIKQVYKVMYGSV